MMNRRDEMGAEYARWLGSRIRARRKAMHLRLDDLAAATGVGRRFLHDLETESRPASLVVRLRSRRRSELTRATCSRKRAGTRMTCRR